MPFLLGLFIEDSIASIRTYSSSRPSL